MTMTSSSQPAIRQLAVGQGVRRSVNDILEAQKAAFLRDGIPDIGTRMDRLTRFHSLLARHSSDLITALERDFGSRPRELSFIGDISGCIAEIYEQKRHLKGWAAEGSPNRIARTLGLKHTIRHDPLGVIGIAGPWNFPVQLSLTPAIGALAAGNRVMVRPSSVTRHTADTLARYVPEYFTEDEFSVITGQDCSGSDFSKLKFDGFFFTGSPAVGVEVAKDCAANLVPVTLELGGKNPVIVDPDADIERAATRIAQSRMVNGGQVCLCPDYVFVPEADVDAFVDTVVATWTRMFASVVDNPHYTSVINEANYDRILGLIADARSKGATVRQVVPDGETLPDRRTRKVAPTLITGVTSDMDMTVDEIFGPVLAVYPYTRIDEAIDHINSGDSPLTMYWYGPENNRYRTALERTRTGSVNGNDFLLNMAPGLPFGGVGKSGMGNYHGKYSFQTFTHSRAVAYSSARLSSAAILAPPYSRLNAAISEFAAKAIRWSDGSR